MFTIACSLSNTFLSQFIILCKIAKLSNDIGDSCEKKVESRAKANEIWELETASGIYGGRLEVKMTSLRG
jgi:hypothetical protein